jgi:hypothetical protein
MPQRQSEFQKELRVDFTLHSFPADLLQEFVKRIVKPYFKGNIKQAFTVLIEEAIVDEMTFKNATIEPAIWNSHEIKEKL